MGSPTDKSQTIRGRGNNPNSRANLRPFPVGNHANPHGRPAKADCLVSCIKAEMAKVDKATGLTGEQKIAIALMAKAEAGDLLAIRLALEYTVAKPTQAIDATLSGDMSFTFLSKVPRPQRVVATADSDHNG